MMAASQQEKRRLVLPAPPASKKPALRLLAEQEQAGGGAAAQGSGPDPLPPSVGASRLQQLNGRLWVRQRRVALRLCLHCVLRCRLRHVLCCAARKLLPLPSLRRTGQQQPSWAGEEEGEEEDELAGPLPNDTEAALQLLRAQFQAKVGGNNCPCLVRQRQQHRFLHPGASKLRCPSSCLAGQSS